MCAVCGAPTSLACLRVPASNSQRLPRTVDRRAAYISPPRLVCVMCTSFLPVAFGGSRCVPIRPLVLCARSTEPTDHPSGSVGLAGTPMGTYRPPGCPFLIRTPMGTRVTRGHAPLRLYVQLGSCRLRTDLQSRVLGIRRRDLVQSKAKIELHWMRQ